MFFSAIRRIKFHRSVGNRRLGENCTHKAALIGLKLVNYQQGICIIMYQPNLLSKEVVVKPAT